MVSSLLMSLVRSFALCGVVVAAEQIDPAIYARLFMNNRPMFDRMSAAVLEKLGDGGKVLDLASGPGEPAVTLASLSPNVQIVCTDFQKEMNEKARARAVKATVDKNMVFAVTSADDLSQWDDNTFDAVTMSYGLMFIPDKAKSLREIHRVLKPGGFAYLSVWKDLPFYNMAREVMNQVTKTETPDFAINPMKLKDANAVEDLAKGASMKIIADEMVAYPFKTGTPKETADSLLVLAGGMLKQIVDGGDEDAMGRFHKIVESEVESRGWKQGDEVSIPDNAAQLLTIQKPIGEQEL